MSKFTSDFKSGFNSGYTSGRSFTAPKRTQILTGLFAFLVGLIGGIFLYQGIAPQSSIAVSIESTENTADDTNSATENTPKIRKLSQKTTPELTEIKTATTPVSTPAYTPKTYILSNITKAQNCANGAKPIWDDTAIGYCSWNNQKTLLMAHVYGPFAFLPYVNISDKIIYNGAEYTVISNITVPETSVNTADYLAKDSINSERIYLMTCAGAHNENRTIVTAIKN